MPLTGCHISRHSHPKHGIQPGNGSRQVSLEHITSHSRHRLGHLVPTGAISIKVSWAACLRPGVQLSQTMLSSSMPTHSTATFLHPETRFCNICQCNHPGLTYNLLQIPATPNTVHQGAACCCNKESKLDTTGHTHPTKAKQHLQPPNKLCAAQATGTFETLQQAHSSAEPQR
jgi:hypothetical protein